jgi:L-alanine-DL-glutamate epimerase-like enolase superfamily enzyme
MFVKIPVLQVSRGGIAPYRGHDLPEGQGLENAISCIFKVITDEGLIGWGETNPLINYQVQRAIFESFIKPMIVGISPLGINSVISRVFHTFEPPIDARGILAGIDVACWDIMGKVLNRPISSLIGGMVRDRVDIAYCLGLENSCITKEKTLEIKDRGYKTLKTTGGVDILWDIKRAELIRDCTGDDFHIRIDMNEAYDTSQALHYMTAVEHLHLEYVEQPIRVNQFSALAMLKTRTRTPIAINEDCYIPHNLFDYIQADAIDVAVVDLDPSGGITGLIKMADFSEEASLPLVHHCGFDMGIKLAAILQVASARIAFSRAIDSTYMAHADDILTDKIKIVEGSYIIPSGPGLGVEVDEDKIRHYQIAG